MTVKTKTGENMNKKYCIGFDIRRCGSKYCCKYCPREPLCSDSLKCDYTEKCVCRASRLEVMLEKLDVMSRRKVFEHNIGLSKKKRSGTSKHHNVEYEQ